MSIIKMNDFFKISIAEAFDEYELHCKARNLSKNTLKRHLEDYNLCGPESWCKKIPEDSKRRAQRHLYGSAHFGFHFRHDGTVWT